MEGHRILLGPINIFYNISDIPQDIVKKILWGLKMYASETFWKQ